MDFFVQEESSLHHFRTEIPNIIGTLGLDPYQLSLYYSYKRCAGDKGGCWKSNKTLMEEMKISLRKLQQVKKELAQPFEKLAGKSLIKVVSRKRSDNSSMTDLVTIVDIWPENAKYFYDKTNKSDRKKEDEEPPQDRAHQLPPTVHHVPYKEKVASQDRVHEVVPGGALGSTEEEPFKEEERDKSLLSQLADASRRRASFLFEKIRSINPKAKRPNLDAWAADIEKLMRIDKQTEEEITSVIEWVFNDDFWCQNILSGRKLREKFNQLYIRMIKHKQSPKRWEEKEDKERVEKCKKNQQWAKSFLGDKPTWEGKNYIKLKDNGIEVNINGNWGMLGFLENGFADQVQAAYTKVRANY